jgi:hypothetical protein
MVAEIMERGWFLSWTRLPYLAIPGRKTSCTLSPAALMAEVRGTAHLLLYTRLSPWALNLSRSAAESMDRADRLQPPVILSAMSVSRSEADTESKDPNDDHSAGKLVGVFRLPRHSLRERLTRSS